MQSFNAPNAVATGPMNSFPRWIYLMLVGILAFGIFYASPNIFGKNFAVQVNGLRVVEVTEADRQKIDDLLKEKGVAVKSVEYNGRNVLVRVNSYEQQSQVSQLLKGAFNEQLYAIARNKVSAAPAWLRNFGADAMNLGLDLSGGIEFLMEVDMERAIKNRNTQIVEDIKSSLRKNKRRGAVVKTTRDGQGVEVRFRSEDRRATALETLEEEFSQELSLKTFERSKYFFIGVTLKESVINETRDNAIIQNISTLRNRVNELGVAEPLIQREGASRIVVQLPGVQESAEAKGILGRTASLEFRMAHDNQQDIANALASGIAPAGTEILKDRAGQSYLIKKEVIVSGANIVNATSGTNHEDGRPQVNITLDGKGGDLMRDASAKNLKKIMASVYIEYITVEKEVNGKKVRQLEERRYVINDARIQAVLGKNFVITGLSSMREAASLALELRSGALSAPVYIVRENLVGASLGDENIAAGVMSIQIGFIAVIVFMMLYYRVFGVIASVALVTNLVLIVAFMSILGATLTLPGMAGIVLTVGMAVDANVLIFERIREELRDGSSVQQAIHSGYDKALSTIADANITTLVAAIVLLGFGSGPIKGFAITLALGIMTSMLTAIVGSRAIVNLLYGGKSKAKLSI